MKEGKIGRKDGQPLPGEDEPLHAYVTANNPENVKKAVEKVRVDVILCRYRSPCLKSIEFAGSANVSVDFFPHNIMALMSYFAKPSFKK